MAPSSSSSPSLSTLVMTAAAAFAGGSLLTALYLRTRNTERRPPSFPATTRGHDREKSTAAADPTAELVLRYPTYDHVNDPVGSFERICDMLVADVLEELPRRYDLPPRETKWLETMLDHNVRGGKMNRGLMVVEAGVAMLREKKKKKKNGMGGNGGGGADVAVDNVTLCRLAVLGWAVEWLQAWLLVADDIMDSSVTRRGRPCWYKTLGETWYVAINDAVTIENLVYTKILKRHFQHDGGLLLQLWDLMLETTLQTELGQLSDTLCDVLDLKDLTPSRWELIVTYKTAYYSFYLSVAFAMVMAGVTDPAAYDAAREILVVMGVYFQAQDDYLDCFATPEQLGKVGTDIADKKCGWLFTKAYHELIDAEAHPEQRALLDDHYGKCEVGSPEEAKIKDLYRTLGLPALYERYEQSSYERIMQLRDSEAGATLERAGVPWTVFEAFLAKVYKRSM
jgi:farnesyl diphosphate synthase